MNTMENQRDELRSRLLAKLKIQELHWERVDLGYRASVEVCAPASVSVSYDEVKEFDQLFTAGGEPPPPLYIPVSKAEQWALADHFQGIPLTQRVSDSIHRSPNFVKIPHHNGDFAANTSTDNFVNYSWYLSGKGATHTRPFSGAIKLWILSNVRSVKSETCNPPDYSREDPSVNYGFYWSGHPLGRIQGAASCHRNFHTDYSQLLQFMRDLRIDGHRFDMGTALLTAHPGIFNEAAPYRMTKSDLSQLPFVKPIASTSKETLALLSGRWEVKYPSGTETYSFKGNTVDWSDASGKSGSGFWIEREQQIFISWAKSGSTEVWPLGTSVSTTLNFGTKGTARKL